MSLSFSFVTRRLTQICIRSILTCFPIILIVNVLSIVVCINGVIKKKMYGFALAFYWICFSIVSNLVFNVGTFMNERFLYFSSLGFCLLASWSIWKLIGITKIKTFSKKQYAYSLFIIVICGLFGFKTFNRNYAWKDNKTLFETDVKVSSNSNLPHSLTYHLFFYNR